MLNRYIKKVIKTTQNRKILIKKSEKKLIAKSLKNNINHTNKDMTIGFGLNWVKKIFSEYRKKPNKKETIRIENDPKFTYASTQNIAGKEPTIPREASLELNQAIASWVIFTGS